MPKKVVIDSGPLIALFDKDDRYHQDALKFIKKTKIDKDFLIYRNIKT